MTLVPGEVEWLAKHMGHSTDIHKLAYRIHTTSIEVTKVGKVLSTLDSTAPNKLTTLQNLQGISMFSSIILNH